MDKIDKFSKLTSIQKEAYIVKATLRALQELGGHAERSEIRERVLDADDELAEFSKIIRVSKKTNIEWSPFAYNFNFAFKDLQIAGYVTYERRNPVVSLTEKGLNMDWANFDVDRDVMKVAAGFWEERKNKEGVSKDDEHEAVQNSKNMDLNDEYYEKFKVQLLEAISKMSPKKFESFSRELLKNMNIEFTSKGTQISNDGGIDGHGYARTSNYQTQRVVIQCKRWQGNVGSVEIDRFLGSMNKFQADYGIFITSGRYTAAAREAARAGTPITLIDGDELVRLVVKYKLHIYEVKSYALDEYYDE